MIKGILFLLSLVLAFEEPIVHAGDGQEAQERFVVKPSVELERLMPPSLCSSSKPRVCLPDLPLPAVKSDPYGINLETTLMRANLQLQERVTLIRQGQVLSERESAEVGKAVFQYECLSRGLRALREDESMKAFRDFFDVIVIQNNAPEKIEDYILVNAQTRSAVTRSPFYDPLVGNQKVAVFNALNEDYCEAFDLERLQEKQAHFFHLYETFFVEPKLYSRIAKNRLDTWKVFERTHGEKACNVMVRSFGSVDVREMLSKAVAEKGGAAAAEDPREKTKNFLMAQGENNRLWDRFAELKYSGAECLMKVIYEIQSGKRKLQNAEKFLGIDESRRFPFSVNGSLAHAMAALNNDEDYESFSRIHPAENVAEEFSSAVAKQRVLWKLDPFYDISCDHPDFTDRIGVDPAQRKSKSVFEGQIGGIEKKLLGVAEAIDSALGTDSQQAIKEFSETLRDETELRSEVLEKTYEPAMLGNNEFLYMTEEEFAEGILKLRDKGIYVDDGVLTTDTGLFVDLNEAYTIRENAIEAFAGGSLDAAAAQLANLSVASEKIPAILEAYKYLVFDQGLSPMYALDALIMMDAARFYKGRYAMP
ncbi:MAG: hypothetical protein AB1540_12625 [Bdellovibrionota bacterium]